MQLVKVPQVLIACAALLGGVGVAEAQQQPRSVLPGVGIAGSVGGGVVGFTGQSMRDVTDAGGSWTARLTIGTQLPLGFEVAYIGTAQNIQTLTEGSALVSNGFEGNLRLNVLTGMWQPYLFAGLAWKHYSISDVNLQTSDASSTDNVGEVPLGAGLAMRYEGFVADARFDIRPSFDNALIAGLGDNSLTNWGVNAKVGFEF